MISLKALVWLLSCSIAYAQTQEAANALYQSALARNDAYQTLADLTTQVGHRISGSTNYDRAMVWGIASLQAKGFTNVRVEKVMVPRWVRGQESAELISPRPLKLSMLGLGMSVGTPKDGITAEVIVVSSFEELTSRGKAVAGKIVLFDVPFESYGKTVIYRTAGASRAAQLGAVACLIRSVGSSSLNTPHTGGISYTEGIPKIPAAALSLEHANLLHRMAIRGERVIVKLMMDAERLPDIEQGNIVGEIIGSKSPNEIIVVSGHLDSWDVGQGAQDDGVGCAIAIESAALLGSKFRPERTIRVVLWANEENGLAGGRAYRDSQLPNLQNHVALIESDSGNGRVQGFTIDLTGRFLPGSLNNMPLPRPASLDSGVIDRFKSLARFQSVSGATKYERGGSGADVSPMVESGAVGIGVSHETARYFDYHHTEADTLDKIIPEDLQHNVGAVAVLIYSLSFTTTRLK